MRTLHEPGALTPIRTAHDCIIVLQPHRRAARDAKTSKLHSPVFVREDIRTLDVTVDDTLIVEVHEPFKDLQDIAPLITPVHQINIDEHIHHTDLWRLTIDMSERTSA